MQKYDENAHQSGAKAFARANWVEKKLSDLVGWSTKKPREKPLFLFELKEAQTAKSDCGLLTKKKEETVHVESDWSDHCVRFSRRCKDHTIIIIAQQRFKQHSATDSELVVNLQPCAS